MECFKVYISEIEGRLDPSPYHPVRLNTIKKIKSSKYKAVPLREVAEFKKKIVNSKPDNLIYVGLENIESNTGIFIPSKERKEKFGSAFSFEKGDILFPKLRPYLNKVYLAEFDGVCSTEFHVLKPIKCNGLYLFTFLNSRLVVNQTSYLMTGNTLPRLQTDEVKSLLILIPPLEIQDRIVEIINKTYTLKKSKETEAQKLLDSINDYVLDELRIKFSKIEEEKIYRINSEELENNRCDPYYFNPKFKKILMDLEKSKIKLIPLKEISIKIFNGKTPAKEDYADEGNLILKVNCLRNNRISWENLSYFKDGIPNIKTIKDKDILLLSSAHQGDYLGKNPCIAEIPDNIKDKRVYFVGEIISIRADLDKINPHYLLAILKLNEYYLLINREKRGQTSHLYPEDLGNVEIPLPPPEIQNKIADEVKQRMKKAEQLQKEAKEILEKAKQEVEDIILNGVENEKSQ